MNKSDSIGELMKATIAVMQEVKGIDKTMVIGTGNNSYKGVPDQEVKKIIGESMAKNGLAIFPIDIEENTQLSEWDETSQQYGTKRKQSIFTKVKTTYLLTHVSGEFITLMGYGHGVDSQDKSAGKATTYALKYALLYTFLIPTGKIDDSDTIHSDNIETPAKPKETAKTAAKIETWMSEKQFTTLKERLSSTEPEIYESGLRNYDAFCVAPFGMKKEFKSELEKIVKMIRP